MALLKVLTPSRFDVQVDLCHRDTFYIYIKDNEITNVNLVDTLICLGQSILLNEMPTIAVPMPDTFRNQNPIWALPTGNPVLSTINVNGLFANELRQGMVRNICVNIETGNAEGC